MSPPPIPVTVVGGYLGAGKTTLVNHVLRQAQGRRIVVMVNDFGAVSVDSALITARDGDTLTLANGCVCCSIGGDLFAAFDCAIDRPERADAILIEASGVAEPERIADFARAEPELGLDSIAVLVDCSAIEGLMADRYVGRTVERQLAAADLLILNKVDLVDAPARRALRDALSDRAPRAALVEAEHAAVPLDLLLGASPVSGFACAAPPAAAIDHEAIFARWSFAGAGFASEAALRATLARIPARIHRLKGFVRLADSGETRLVQVVAGRVDVTPCAPPPGQPAPSTLVAIWPRGAADAAELDTIFATR
jgi:G3E family GTPase